MPTAEKIDDFASATIDQDGRSIVTYTARYQAMASASTVKSVDMLYSTTGLPRVGTKAVAFMWTVYCVSVSANRRSVDAHRSLWEFDVVYSSVPPNNTEHNQPSGAQVNPLLEPQKISFSTETEYREVTDAKFIQGEDKNGKPLQVGS